MKSIGAKQLRERMRRDEDLAVINVLDPDAFEREHIPGSWNVPVSRDDFVDAVRDHVRDDARPVVVYCASRKCTASPTAARRLTEGGFSDVIDFEGGMAEWKHAQFDVETGEAVPSR